MEHNYRGLYNIELEIPMKHSMYNENTFPPLEMKIIIYLDDKEIYFAESNLPTLCWGGEYISLYGTSYDCPLNVPIHKPVKVKIILVGDAGTFVARHKSAKIKIHKISRFYFDRQFNNASVPIKRTMDF